MKKVNVFKANATMEVVEDASINIGPEEIPESKSLGDNRKKFKRDAKAIVVALETHLPGGTFNEVLIQMLRVKAGHFIVPYKTFDKKKG